MGFWIGMTLCNFLMPVLMVVLGRIMAKHPPKSINSSYGYCTPMSRKNQDTWDFAQTCCGNLWWKIGWILMPFAIIAMIPVIGKDIDTVGILAAIVASVQGVIMILTIFIVERDLRKNFDKEGNKINQRTVNN